MTCVDARTSSTSSAISAGFIRRAEEGTSLRFGDLTEVAAIGVCAVSRMFCFFSALPKTKNHRDADRNRCPECRPSGVQGCQAKGRSEEHTSELQSRLHLVCRLLLEKKKKLAYCQ